MKRLPLCFLKKAKNLLDEKYFSFISHPIEINQNVEYNVPVERQYILRMMVRAPGFSTMIIPEELNWLKPTIYKLDEIQKENGLNNPFIYVTVRHGLTTTETDDLWHVDGFSKRIPHLPEQNYIWSDMFPTEYLNQKFPIPSDFDALKHNIHYFFQDRANLKNLKTCKEKSIYLFDPYFVHRRQSIAQNQKRTFWRISFLPIEIQDNNATKNPLLPKKTYNQVDIRNFLTRYSKK